MASGDVFQVLDYQNFVAEVDAVLNVYYFLQTSVDGSASDLAAGFITDLIPEITAIQTGVVKHNQLITTNLFNVEDFDTTIFASNAGFGQIGTTSAETLPIHDVVSYRLVRTDRTIRNGWKRYTGIPEAAQTSGSIFESSYIASLNALRNALIVPVVGGVTAGEYKPIVLKRIRTNPGVKPPKYRLPENQGEADYSEYTNVLLNLQVRTQDTRKL